MTVGELEYYIADTPVQIIDLDGTEIARYDGKNSLEEMTYMKVCGIWAGYDYDAQRPMLVISIL